MAAKNKKTATSPVEAPETVEAPDVAPEVSAPPVAPLVLPEQVLGWDNMTTLDTMHLRDQRELRIRVNALAVREKNENWDEFESVINFSDMLFDYAIDKDAYEELRTGRDALENTRAIVFAFISHLKK